MQHDAHIFQDKEFFYRFYEDEVNEHGVGMGARRRRAAHVVHAKKRAGGGASPTFSTKPLLSEAIITEG